MAVKPTKRYWANEAKKAGVKEIEGLWAQSAALEKQGKVLERLIAAAASKDFNVQSLTGGLVQVNFEKNKVKERLEQAYVSVYPRTGNIRFLTRSALSRLTGWTPFGESRVNSDEDDYVFGHQTNHAAHLASTEAEVVKSNLVETSESFISDAEIDHGYSEVEGFEFTAESEHKDALLTFLKSMQLVHGGHPARNLMLTTLYQRNKIDGDAIINQRVDQNEFNDLYGSDKDYTSQVNRLILSVEKAVEDNKGSVRFSGLPQTLHRAKAAFEQASGAPLDHCINTKANGSKSGLNRDSKGGVAAA